MTQHHTRISYKFLPVPLKLENIIINLPLWKLTIRSNFSEDFTELYNKVNSSLSVESSLADLDAEHHFNSLNTVWTDILNSIALFKCFKLKPKSEPWTDNNFRSLRQSCREAERKWKKDKLQISFGILKNCLSLYQRAVKKAKTSYFSNLIEKHHCTPKILFSVINSALNPPNNSFQNPSFALSEDFLRHFCDKVTNLRAQIQVTDYVELPPTNPTPPWTTFNLVSLQTVKEVITKLKPSFCPLDIIHPRFLRQIIETVGPGLVSLLNKCLKSGSTPDDLKMAMVTPVLKKPSLDASEPDESFAQSDSAAA